MVVVRTSPTTPGLYIEHGACKSKEPIRLAEPEWPESGADEEEEEEEGEEEGEEEAAKVEASESYS